MLELCTHGRDSGARGAGKMVPAEGVESDDIYALDLMPKRWH